MCRIFKKIRVNIFAVIALLGFMATAGVSSLHAISFSISGDISYTGDSQGKSVVVAVYTEKAIMGRSEPAAFFADEEPADWGDGLEYEIDGLDAGTYYLAATVTDEGEFDSNDPWYVYEEGDSFDDASEINVVDSDKTIDFSLREADNDNPFDPAYSESGTSKHVLKWDESEEE